MAAPTPSLLDFTQILQRVFDEANGRLRTDATATVVAGSIECIISQVDDSIRIGDGTDLVTTTTTGSQVGLDVNVISEGSVTTPFVQNVVLASANTEYSLVIPDNTKVLIIKPRLGRLQVAVTSGQSGTNYFTINKGSNYAADALKTSSATLYVQSSVAGDVVELHGWNS